MSYYNFTEGKTGKKKPQASRGPVAEWQPEHSDLAPESADF